MTIPDFKVWQQSECRRLGITIEEHNRILEVLNKMSPSGWSSNYDAFLNIVEVSPKSLAVGFSNLSDPDGPWDTGEDEDENGPYGM